MHTERFQRLRKRSLNIVFEKEIAKKIWRSTVRSQLRSMDIKDLYDHYDFNFNIEDRIQAIKASILDGSYAVGTPLIYRTEKKIRDLQTHGDSSARGRTSAPMPNRASISFCSKEAAFQERFLLKR